MPAQATVFSSLLQHVPWGEFARCVARHRMDAGHRGLDARSHLAALIAGQLIEANGLRDIEATLAANAPGLRRRRIVPVRRSTLSEANRYRSPEAFEDLIPALLAQIAVTSETWVAEISPREPRISVVAFRTSRPRMRAVALALIL